MLAVGAYGVHTERSLCTGLGRASVFSPVVKVFASNNNHTFVGVIRAEVAAELRFRPCNHMLIAQ